MSARPDLHDRIAGALSMSALGDAIGLPHESRGLRGEICAAADTLDPFELPVADAFRDPQPNPWNIWAPAQRTANRRGVVSDDTAIRITIIEPWLADELRRGRRLDTLTDRDWLGWLTRRRAPEGQPWREAMAHEHAQQWPAMYALADGDTAAQAPDPCFFRTGIPVCFGTFLFAELALHHAHRPAVEVFDAFCDVCRLDQGPAKTCTALVAALIATAAGHASRPHLGELWEIVVADLTDQNRLDASVLHDLCLRPIQLGQRSRHLGKHAFLARLKHDIYDHPDAPTHDLKPFDPTLQLAQLAACVAYADDDPMLAMQLLALGPGDTDTLAATLGLILGASLGHAACLNTPARDALHHVEQTTHALFDRSLNHRVACQLGPPRNPLA